jgi:molybdopterin-guanine dinucleotide biosynthesis protein A
VVLSCDTPFITTGLLGYLLDAVDNYQAAVPRHDGFIEPLCAVYATNVIWTLQKTIEKGLYKMHDFLTETDTTYIDITKGQDFWSEELFTNINTQKDLSGGGNKS